MVSLENFLYTFFVFANLSVTPRRFPHFEKFLLSGDFSDDFRILKSFCSAAISARFATRIAMLKIDFYFIFIKMSLIKLNVGGVAFTTTIATLMKYDSFLSRMLTSSVPIERDDDMIFIDRDPNLFKYIMKFLRNNTIPQDKSFYFLQEFLEEADFYQIETLIERLSKEIHDTQIYFNEIIHTPFENHEKFKARWIIDRDELLNSIKLEKFPNSYIWFVNEMRKNKTKIMETFDQIDLQKAHGNLEAEIELLYTDWNTRIKIMNLYTNARDIYAATQ